MPRYSIPEIANEAIASFDEASELHDWMEETVDDGPVDFEQEDFDCRRYIASSIKYATEGGGSTLYQTGCSPNYFGGLWSLACCKHDMRGNWPVKNSVFGWNETNEETLAPKQPFFVFTYSRKSHGHQFLASVALVTRGFKTMEAYGQYLQSREDLSEAARDRLTQVPDSSGIADIFGDCHYGPENASSDHPHMKDSPPCSCSTGGSPKHAYKMDTDGTHVICVSEPGNWITWEEPVFETRSGSKGQNRWGRPIKSSDFNSWAAFYRDLLGEDGWLKERKARSEAP